LETNWNQEIVKMYHNNPIIKALEKSKHAALIKRDPFNPTAWGQDLFKDITTLGNALNQLNTQTLSPAAKQERILQILFDTTDCNFISEIKLIHFLLKDGKIGRMNKQLVTLFENGSGLIDLLNSVLSNFFDCFRSEFNKQTTFGITIAAPTFETPTLPPRTQPTGSGGGSGSNVRPK
jgi:hypothetical protein